MAGHELVGVGAPGQRAHLAAAVDGVDQRAAGRVPESARRALLRSRRCSRRGPGLCITPLSSCLAGCMGTGAASALMQFCMGSPVMKEQTVCGQRSGRAGSREQYQRATRKICTCVTIPQPIVTIRGAAGEQAVRGDQASAFTALSPSDHNYIHVG